MPLSRPGAHTDETDGHDDVGPGPSGRGRLEELPMSRRGAIREYADGSLWVLPSISALLALLVGFGVSRINISPNSRWAALAFQGTADDARNILTNVTSTVVTVIAIVLDLQI